MSKARTQTQRKNEPGSEEAASKGSRTNFPPALLPVLAFCSGAAVMIIEISGARLVAPVYGNTVYTWTAIIGVVLVALSAGGYLGGRLADRRNDLRLLACFPIGAGLFAFAIPALALGLGSGSPTPSLVAGPLWMSFVLFVVPAVLLGAVGPYSVKMLSVLRTDHAVGRSAGLISMMGSLGSFVGTFATGFWLLSAFDLRVIMAVTGGLLVVLGGVVLWRARNAGPGVLVALLAVAAAGGAGARFTPVALGEDVIYARNSYYHLIRVTESDVDGRRVRTLMLDTTTEGAISLDGGPLPVAYQNFWRLLTLDPDFRPERSLFIGAGAFGMPREVAAQWPEAEVDVVEIDPDVIEVGERFFGAGEDANLFSHAADGRMFLRAQPEEHYDFIFGDAYNGVSYIPPHLVTSEFFGLVAERLRPGGIYMMNLISAVHGPDSELSAGILAGLAEHFDELAVFTVHTQRPGTRQNLILMAANRPLDMFQTPAGVPRAGVRGQAARMAAGRVEQARIDALVGNARPFTDKRNPIDLLVARQIRRAADPSGHGF